MNRIEFLNEKTKQLYEMLSKTPDLDGRIEFENNVIEWHRNGKVYLSISYDSVVVYSGKYNIVFHWHPDESEVSELYDLLCQAGKAGSILVVRDLLLWQHLYFVGPANEYKQEQKWSRHFDRKYIFGALN
ncbi:MAG: hypothetical protein PHV95_00680 [Eubacteriales bacterium]|nr:hypothetical protein [Eubacteriales bacterium]